MIHQTLFMRFAILPILFITFILQHLQAQQPIATNVYPWKGEGDIMFDGSGAILSRQSLIGHSLKSKKTLKFNSGLTGYELFFIVKYGPIEINLNGKAYQLDKGSVVFVLPGDEVTFRNGRKDPVEFYEMQMQSASPDVQRGRSAGPSFVIDWNDMVYKPHDRGGVRQLFDRKTVHTNRFDIHITSLNPGLSSHAPHTHKNEEIILMVDGEGEMVHGDKKRMLYTGGAAWVESMIPHNITNTGKRPAVYFAIQWN
jgi:(S)-ureidoglycine aminohydrolase